MRRLLAAGALLRVDMVIWRQRALGHPAVLPNCPSQLVGTELTACAQALADGQDGQLISGSGQATVSEHVDAEEDGEEQRRHGSAPQAASHQCSLCQILSGQSRADNAGIVEEMSRHDPGMSMQQG